MKGDKIMCYQKEVLEKIRKKGKVNGYDVELAEAQAKDYVRMKKRIVKIESDVNTIKTDLAVVNGKIDTVLQRLDGPAEQERKDGIMWTEIKSGLRSWKFWCFAVFLLMCVALAGEKVLEIMHWLPTGA